jgi:hypothetical protein
MGDEEAVVVVEVVRISNLIIQRDWWRPRIFKRKTHSCFSRFSSTKGAWPSGKKGDFDEECQPIREREEISEVSKRFFTANKKKQKSAIMEEEVQALVVDNGSGMCKAGE